MHPVEGTVPRAKIQSVLCRQDLEAMWQRWHYGPGRDMGLFNFSGARFESASLPADSTISNMARTRARAWQGQHGQIFHLMSVGERKWLIIK
jgi:hypothetical protein